MPVKKPVSSFPKFIIGRCDFLQVLQTDCDIDRTPLIIDLLDNKQIMNSVCLITCPRRSGKSMNMKMLKDFLGVEFDKDQKLLQSSNTKIGQIIERIKYTKNLKVKFFSNSI